MNLYTWQKEVWRQIWVGGRERLPHALLFCGRPGLGKRDFAKACAQALLCESWKEENLPCGVCYSCTAFEQSTHPDFRLLVPTAEQQPSGDATTEMPPSKEKKVSEVITIDQVRGLADFVSLTSHQSGQRVVLITPAEQLNANAANALLKMLEEPPAQVTFLLVTNQLARILPTIRSRCRLLRLPIPDAAVAKRWLAEQGCKDAALNLAMAGGAPLEAIQFAAYEPESKHSLLSDLWDSPDPLQAADIMQTLPPAEGMRYLQTWIHDLLSVKLGLPIRYHIDARQIQQRLCNQTNLLRLIELHKFVLDASRLVRHPLNLRLFWESIFIKYFAALT
ncbi:MAG: DNA polymerase III subunit delta' [Burkholderiales bacterium]